MVEIRRGSSGETARERLPWLEPVEDEDEAYYGGQGAAGYGGLILAALLVLVAIALVTAGVLWMRNRASSAGGGGQVIKAEPGPYKTRPDDPGGMKPDANGQVTYGTSAGQDIDSPIDLNALPEQPMVSKDQPAQPAQPSAPAQPAPAPRAAAPQPAVPAPVAAKPQPALAPAVPPPVARPAAPPKAEAAPAPIAPPSASGGPGAVQLGAFSSDAKAKEAWKSLSGRFVSLKPLAMGVTPVEAGGKTLYRLRASGASDAARLCAQLKVAGESCSVVR